MNEVQKRAAYVMDHLNETSRPSRSSHNLKHNNDVISGEYTNATSNTINTGAHCNTWQDKARLGSI